MQLVDHVSIAVRDLARAKPFYRAVMAALGAPEAYDEPRAAFLRDPEGNAIELVTHIGHDGSI